MYSTLIGNGLLYYRSLRYKSNIMKYKTSLEKSQYWSYDKILNHQQERLQLLIRHAGVNVPYYKKLFKNLGINIEEFTLKELKKIPPVTKDIIRSNYEDFIAENSQTYPHRRVNTSGSTGSPFNYLQDLNADEMQVACSHRGMGYAGYHYGDKIVQVAGSALIPEISLTQRQKLSYAIHRIRLLPAIRLNDNIMRSFVKEINAFSPAFIRGYPSSIFTLAFYIEENQKKLKCFPKAIITTAEMLLPKYREKIEKVFQCPVFDEYGCNDGGLISYECKEHHGLHYAAEKVIVEIDIDKKSLSPQEYGEVILTDLYNFSMPFIRYKNGDIAKLSTNSCLCGRNLPMIEAVYGRSGDILKFKDQYLATPALTLIFKDFNFDRYQLIKESDDQMKVNIIKGQSYIPSEECKLEKILSHHLNGKVNIRVNFVTHIDTTASGKWKFFIDETIKNK